mgnify:CR=1 FL=1
MLTLSISDFDACHINKTALPIYIFFQITFSDTVDPSEFNGMLCFRLRSIYFS